MARADRPSDSEVASVRSLKRTGGTPVPLLKRPAAAQPDDEQDAVKLKRIHTANTIVFRVLGDNPLVSLKLKRDKAAKRPELTDDEIREIREALKEEPEWMQAAFDIALHTGCRLRETRIPLNCVDFKEDKITFQSPKGGEDRAFSIPMPSARRPLFERIRKEKQKFTVEFPFQPSRRWQQFFIKIKNTHLYFHCLRVTYVNRLRRAGVPREAAMRLVNHSSDLIHQIYQRE